MEPSALGVSGPDSSLPLHPGATGHRGRESTAKRHRSRASCSPHFADLGAELRTELSPVDHHGGDRSDYLFKAQVNVIGTENRTNPCEAVDPQYLPSWAGIAGCYRVVHGVLRTCSPAR